MNLKMDPVEQIWYFLLGTYLENFIVYVHLNRIKLLLKIERNMERIDKNRN